MGEDQKQSSDELQIKPMETVLRRIGKAMFEQPVDPDMFGMYDYIIALDLGGGNCSAAISDLREGKDSGPRVLKLSVLGETSLWSTIGYDTLPGETGDVAIGLAAQNKKFQYSNYKTVPTNLNLEKRIKPDNYTLTGNTEQFIQVRRTVRNLTEDYIKAFYSGMLAHPECSFLRCVNPKRIMIIVGHPSSPEWKNPEAHQNLVNMVKSATGISTVLTTSESNSAILYALHTRDYVVGRERILIIDLGAYSADITFIDRRMREERKFSSITLGGKAIDKNLEAILLQNSGIPADQLDPQFNALFEARRVKEAYWPGEKHEQSVYLGGKKVVFTHKDFRSAVEAMPIKLYNSETGETSSYSYVEHLKKFMAAAKDKNGMNIQNVDWVLITGGAARMRPAMEAIRKQAEDLWGVSRDDIWPNMITDEMIDEAVPFGSLQFYLKAKDTMTQIPDVYNALVRESENLISPLGDQISQNVVSCVFSEIIEPVVKKFRDANQDLSIADLENSLNQEFNNEQHKDRLKEKSDKAISEVLTKKQPDFQKIITEFLKSLFGLEADHVHKTIELDPSIPPIDEDSAISRAIQASLPDWAEILALILLPVLVPFLLIYGLSQLVGKIYRTIFYDEEQMAEYNEKQKKAAEESKKQREKEALAEQEKPRKKGERERIYKGVTKVETKEKLYSETRDKITQQLKLQCNKDQFGIPDSYMDKLSETICNAVYSGR